MSCLHPAQPIVSGFLPGSPRTILYLPAVPLTLGKTHVDRRLMSILGWSNVVHLVCVSQKLVKICTARFSGAYFGLRVLNTSDTSAFSWRLKGADEEVPHILCRFLDCIHKFFCEIFDGFDCPRNEPHWHLLYIYYTPLRLYYIHLYTFIYSSHLFTPTQEWKMRVTSNSAIVPAPWSFKQESKSRSKKLNSWLCLRFSPRRGIVEKSVNNAWPQGPELIGWYIRYMW